MIKVGNYFILNFINYLYIMTVSTTKKSVSKEIDVKKNDISNWISHSMIQQESSCWEPNTFKIVIIILLLLNLLATVGNMMINNISASIEETEAMKVWGIENYEKLKTIMSSDAYKTNYAQNLEMMLLQIQQGNDTGDFVDSSTWENIDDTSIVWPSNDETGMLINDESKSDE